MDLKKNLIQKTLCQECFVYHFRYQMALGKRGYSLQFPQCIFQRKQLAIIFQQNFLNHYAGDLILSSILRRLQNDVDMYNDFDQEYLMEYQQFNVLLKKINSASQLNNFITRNLNCHCVFSPSVNISTNLYAVCVLRLKELYRKTMQIKWENIVFMLFVAHAIKALVQPTVL